MKIEGTLSLKKVGCQASQSTRIFASTTWCGDRENTGL
jgi:hypothetical protein